MKYSNNIDLDRFFYNLQDEIYVVVKLSEDFPNYYPYSDIDIICYDSDRIARKILTTANYYAEKGFTIKISSDNRGIIKIDLYEKSCSKLDFRFDILSEVPKYEKTSIKDVFKYSIIENRISINRDFNNFQYKLYVPDTVHDVIFRYLEYVEYYDIRPDKIKHLNYIIAKLNDEPEQKAFIDKLHYFTKLNPTKLPDNAYFSQHALIKNIDDVNEVAEKKSFKTRIKNLIKSNYLFYKLLKPIVFTYRKIRKNIFLKLEN